MISFPYLPCAAITATVTAATVAVGIISPEEAEAYSFKSFLIVCVAILGATVLLGARLWYNDLIENRDKLVQALNGNTEVILKFTVLFDTLGAEALEKSLRPEGVRHSLPK